MRGRWARGGGARGSGTKTRSWNLVATVRHVCARCIRCSGLTARTARYLRCPEGYAAVSLGYPCPGHAAAAPRDFRWGGVAPEQVVRREADDTLAASERALLNSINDLEHPVDRRRVVVRLEPRVAEAHLRPRGAVLDRWVGVPGLRGRDRGEGAAPITHCLWP